MSNNSNFAKKYPKITKFVHEQGKIEIGYDEHTSCFIVAYDEGGIVFEGQDTYDTIEDAFDDVEIGIEEFEELI